MKEFKGFKGRIPHDDQVLIINHFKNKSNNTIADLMAEFGYSFHQINYILDQYLSLKTSEK